MGMGYFLVHSCNQSGSKINKNLTFDTPQLNVITIDVFEMVLVLISVYEYEFTC